MTAHPIGNPPESWGHLVRAKRRECKLTEHQLAELVGVSEMSIRRIEAAKQTPRLSLMVRIARALHVETIEELFPYPDPWKEPV